MNDPAITDIERIDAPYRRQILLQDVTHESGMKVMRVRIREGNRFTIIDIDAPTARIWGECMLAWSAANAAASHVNNEAP
jgi:hypothetical protein